MSERLLRVLHLEDVEEDAELVKAVLEDSGFRCDVVRVETEADFEAALGRDLDIILADYSLPSFDGLRALELARQRRPDLPFLFVTGALKDDSAVETLRRGATDFIVKERLARLAPAVDRALREFEVRARSARAQEEVTRLNARLQDAVRARDEMLAIVSHDLRNPLGTIMMSAAALLAGGSREGVVALADRISRSAVRMNVLIGDLLDLAHIDAGTLSLQPHPFDVGDAIRESIDLHAELASKKSLRLRADSVAPDLTAHGDRERVLQVLSNLIGNAIKFTPAGGEISVSAARDGQFIVISTTDTGPGIPREDVEHIFDRYWRARRSDRQSLGLGLSIVKGLVEAQGGRVSVASEPGRGAAVSFTLPVAAVEATASPVRPIVLIVDDDPDIRHTLSEALTDAGYRVGTAGDGAEALDLLRSHSPELIILDLMMPRMDGIEFRARQLDDPRLARIPTLVITAFDPLRERIVPMEPDACIRKPVQVGELLGLVRRMVEERGASAAQLR
jgi:signal transduction histidine kinase